MQPVITLTTDFGTSDTYVGVMKGVILGICPAAQIVDITHAIPPQDVAAAARAVETYIPYFPSGSIHVVVVDPGVGSTRRALALSTPHAHFVGPDNGVFGSIWQHALDQWGSTNVQAVALTESRFWRSLVSATFHGRDIFAPVAAHLATGVALTAFGPPCDSIIATPGAAPVWKADGSLSGQVVSIDHFGNCISNIRATQVEQLGDRHGVDVLLGETHVGSVKYTYADVDSGATLALIGSSGYLEIAVRNGHASQTLGIDLGTPVHVTRTS